MGKRMKKVLASAMSLSMVASMAMSGVSATTSRVDSLLSNMSLRQKITQMMMVDFRQWKTADEEAKSDFTKMNSEVKKIVEDMILDQLFSLLIILKKLNKALI